MKNILCLVVDWFRARSNAPGMHRIAAAGRSIVDWYLYTGPSQTLNRDLRNAALRSLAFLILYTPFSIFIILNACRSTPLPPSTPIRNVGLTTLYLGDARALDDINNYDTIISLNRTEKLAPNHIIHHIKDRPGRLHGFCMVQAAEAVLKKYPYPPAGKILINCSMGQSRSVAVLCILAYRWWGLPPMDTYRKICNMREKPLLNVTYKDILKHYE